MILTLGNDSLVTEFKFSIEDAIQSNPNKQFDNIGVYLSGGVDSVALLLLILTELQLNTRLYKIPVTCFTIAKRDFSVDITPKIIELCEKKFNTSIVHINNVQKSINQENIEFKTFLNLYTEYKKTLFFLGINRMPENEIVKFKNKLKVDYGRRKDRFVYYSPFLFLHKPQIIDIFYKLGHEDLLPYTYSCTMQPKIPCGNCYGCEERAWGFRFLEKEDPLFTQNRLTE